MKTTHPRRKCNICPLIVGDEIDQYLKSLERQNYSPQSIEIYGYALVVMDNYLAQAGISRIGDVTAEVLSEYSLSLVRRDLKTASISVYIRAVRGLFRFLESQRRIFINPAAGLTMRNQKRALQRVPTEQEIRVLLATCDVTKPIGLRNRAMLETAYATGARRTELAGIRLRGVDLVERTVRLMGKGRRERVVPLSMSATTWLERYLQKGRIWFPEEGSDALWLGRTRPLDANAISSIFFAQSKVAGMDPVIRPHALRRACATHLLQNGANPVEIQQLLGHADMKHLSQYLAVSMVELKRAHDNSKLGA